MTLLTLKKIICWINVFTAACRSEMKSSPGQRQQQACQKRQLWCNETDDAVDEDKCAHRWCAARDALEVNMAALPLPARWHPVHTPSHSRGNHFNALIFIALYLVGPEKDARQTGNRHNKITTEAAWLKRPSPRGCLNSIHTVISLPLSWLSELWRIASLQWRPKVQSFFLRN